MSDAKEKCEASVIRTDASRQWVAPEFTVLVAGATASGGPILCTSEGYNYHVS